MTDYTHFYWFVGIVGIFYFLLKTALYQFIQWQSSNSELIFNIIFLLFLILYAIFQHLINIRYNTPYIYQLGLAIYFGIISLLLVKIFMKIQHDTNTKICVIKTDNENIKQFSSSIRGNRYYDKKNVEILKKIKFLLKEKGLTINGVKKLLINKSSFNLDVSPNSSINTQKINLRTKLEKISSLVKEIKKLD